MSRTASQTACHPLPLPVTTNRFTLEQHLFFRFISRVSVSLCQLSAAVAACNAFTSCFFCFIFHTIRHATHVRHAPCLLAPPLPLLTASAMLPLLLPQKTFSPPAPIQMICGAAVFKPRRRKINSKTSQLGWNGKSPLAVACSERLPLTLRQHPLFFTHPISLISMAACQVVQVVK